MKDIPSYEIGIPSQFMFLSPESPISSRLGFSTRSFKALIKNGYDTVAKVLSLDERTIGAIKNLGKESIKEILFIQKKLHEQIKNTAKKCSEQDKRNDLDCRFVYTKDTIYPSAYIGALDISLEAHNILRDAGIFSAGKLFSLDEKAINNLANTTAKVTKELIAFIAKEKPLAGKILGHEDPVNYFQKMSQERYDYRMSALEESYNKIPESRLDKSLDLFLQDCGETIQCSINRISPLLKEIKKIGDLKSLFSLIVKTSLTGDVVRIQELLSFNIIEMLAKPFSQLFNEPRNKGLVDILYKRANGFTLLDIAEKRNLTRERIRQIESVCLNFMAAIVNDFPFNILTFIRADTDSITYISSDVIREYLNDFQYSSQLIYLLKNESVYKNYQYNEHYDIFYCSGFEPDFSTMKIKKPVKSLVLREKETKAGKKIEEFLITQKLKLCALDDIGKLFPRNSYVPVGKIIQLSNNIVELKKNYYMHRSSIKGIDEAAAKLLEILRSQFKRFFGYSNRHIFFEAVRAELLFFMNDNGFETDMAIYMLARHLFSKEKYNGCHFLFKEALHIWEKQTSSFLNYKGVLINLAKTTGGIITREETKKYLSSLKLSVNVINNILHDDIFGPIFYFYTESTYILSEYLQIDAVFISKMKNSLDRLLGMEDRIIPATIDKDWFNTLPKLPLELSWNLLILQEVLKYNKDIGYKPLFLDVAQSPYRLSGAIVKTNPEWTAKS
ncbi:MAG: hypothetical protein LBG76_00495 [Treponema sp.]|jgi:hypothetical protein|nr:hypothetical protein [Treponema sp.]